MDYINISGYAFFSIELDQLESLKSSLKTLTRSLELRGSILLAEEGINVFLCGPRETIDIMYKAFVEDYGFPAIAFKESLSDYQPFKRMLVKIKKEIISMGQPQIQPAKQPAPAIDAQTLKEWYEQGKDFVMLDTRNDYEIEVGKFQSALELDIKSFRAFPDAIAALDPSFKDKTIVTYCTGGIRCEKAAPYMIQQGFKDTYQLDGGILKYFEEVGGNHWEGECFVFDKRVSLAADLLETDTTQCFVCRMPVRKEQQVDGLYKISEYCPNCKKPNVNDNTQSEHAY